MKTVLILLATAALLCGCQKAAPDPRIAKLEARISLLESNQLVDQEQINNALSLGETNVLKTHALIGGVRKLMEGESELDQRLFWLENPVNKTGNHSADYNSRLHIDPTTGLPYPETNTMPAEVTAQIRAAAEREWPNDYDMQVFEIKNQTEAWQKLHP